MQRNGKFTSMVSGIKQIQTNSIDEQSKEIVMDIRYTIGKNEYKRMTTEELRDSFLVRGRTIKFKKIQSPYIYYSLLWDSLAFISFSGPFLGAQTNSANGPV